MSIRAIVITLGVASLAACGGSDDGGKASLAKLAGLKNHPAVQAIESGDDEDAYVVNVNLETGTYRVSHGETLDHLASAEGACSEQELTDGRELFTVAKVDEYEANTTSGGERGLRFTVIWPDGFPETTTAFSLDPTDPPAALESVTTYTQRYIELYAPPAPTTERPDASCPEGELCPDVPGR